MVQYKQDVRALAIDTPLGRDQLILTGLSGEERVNALFEFQLELFSPKQTIDPGELLGKQVTCTLRSGAKKRYFTGIVSRFSAGASMEHDHRTYRAEIVPELWLLTHRVDCRIFQHKSVPDIISDVLKDAGLPAYEAVGLKGYPEREYCVQYLETDFDFISRLMEDEGICYFFKHGDDKQTLVLTDQAGAYYTIEESQIELRPQTESPHCVHSWQLQQRFIPSQWAHTDYDFESPHNDLNAESRSVVQFQRGGKWEIFDWRGEYVDKGRGRDMAKRWIGTIESTQKVVEGGGSCRFFAPGGKFTLGRADYAGEKGKTWACATVYHSASDMTHLTGQERASYGNNFVCVPEDVLLRSMRKTRRPLIHGPQTAFVVGPSGEEIYTDKYGRIRVQFHWDRKGKKDENSSCWIRVKQDWAGKSWGHVYTPRIGMEVIVEFLDGDPDTPIVTGCVYNADFMPPWSLPGKKTQSGLLTRSSMGGSGSNANALRFEDEKGSEEVWLHAEKDMKREVENDDTLEVGHDQKEKIKNNREVEITEGNDKLNVKMGKCEIEALVEIKLTVGQSVVTIDQKGVSITGLVLMNDGKTSSTTTAPLITENASGTLTLHGSIIAIG